MVFDLYLSAGGVMCKFALSGPMAWILRYIEIYLYFSAIVFQLFCYSLPKFIYLAIAITVGTI